MHITKLINDNNWSKIYKQLVTNKLSPNYKLPHGNTIIHMASINNNKKIISHYLTKDIGPLLKSNDDGNSPIHLLAIYNYTDTLKHCITTYPDFLNLLNNNNELISNILYNNLDFIKFLCTFDINLIIDDMQNNNIITKNIDDTDKVNDDNYKIIKLLLKKQLDHINQYNDSFLCYAINQEKEHVAKLLIENNYDINKKDSTFLNPLICSVKMGLHNILEMLLNKHVDTNYFGPEGDDNPIVYSIHNNDEYSINLLLDNNFNVLQYDRNLNTPAHYSLINKLLSVQTLLKLIYYSDLNKQNIYGQTPLHILCKNHDFKNYDQALINKKMDIFIKDNFGKRPIDYLNVGTISDFINLVVKSYGKQILDPSYAYLLNNMIKCKTDIESNECTNQLKKYIFVTKRSIPIKEDKVNINMKFINNKQVAYGLFNADALHNMIYTIIMMRKYKNICIPFQYLFNDKYINTKINDYNLFNFSSESMVHELVNIYNNYFYEIQPYLIIWKNKYVNYVNKDLKFLIKKCLVSDKIRYIFIKLTLIPSSTSTHANILIYDKEKNVLERFEPYGLIPYLDSDYLNDFIQNVGITCINENLIYVKPVNMSNDVGIQILSNDSNYNIKKLGDPNGYCLAWTYWFLEMRLGNSDVSASKLMNNMIDNVVKSKVSDNNKLFISFIRNYAGELDKLKNQFMLDAGINMMHIYDLTLNKQNLDKLLKKLKFEFNLIIKDRIN